MSSPLPVPSCQETGEWQPANANSKLDKRRCGDAPYGARNASEVLGGTPMRTHSIAREAWQSTFDSLSRVYDGESASLEVLRPDLGAQFEIERQPFRGISYDTDGIELHFAPRDGRHFVHRVARPPRVQIEERDHGLIDAFAIDTDDDPRIVLRLGAPLASTLLPSSTA